MTQSIIDGSDGDWIDVGNGDQLEQSLKNLRITIPDEVTNLKDSFSILRLYLRFM